MLEAWRRRGRKGAGLDDDQAFMLRELLVWLVGVPVPIAMVIGMFVL